MPKRSYKAEEIVAKLRQVDVLHSQGRCKNTQPCCVKSVQQPCTRYVPAPIQNQRLVPVYSVQTGLPPNV